VLICVYTQGGLPTAARVTSAFADIGRMVDQQLS